MSAFSARDAVIITIGPDNPNTFRRYWETEKIPFLGMPDPQHKVADLYGQEWNLFKLGRVPALLVINKNGQIQYLHYGKSMSDIPKNQLVLELLDKINEIK